MKSIALPYWGKIISLVSNQQGRNLFITRQQSPVLYILDNKGEQFSLSTLKLPCAMQWLIKDATTDKVIMLGADGHLYQSDWQAKKIIKITTVSLLETLNDLGNEYAQHLTYTNQHNQSSSTPRLVEPVALSLLSNTSDNNANDVHDINGDTLAILYPKHMVIWRYQGSQAETFVVVEPLFNSELEDDQNQSNRATAMATSSNGHWLVIGDKSGFVNSYQLSTTSDSILSLSSRKQIHQGAVNALCFEPVSQYFFSAGADKNLYRTHVQGDLHPVDRAKASQHSEMITALCVSDTRLFTAADDKSIKSWGFDKGASNTCKEDLTKTRLLVLSSYAEQPALIAVGQDQSIRFIPIKAAIETAQSDEQNEKLQPVAYIIKDGYQRVSELFKDSSNNSDAAFKEGLALLNTQVDPKTLDIVTQFLTAKSSDITANQALQLVPWVAATRLDKTAKTLEQLLNSTISANVRLAAFSALAEQANYSERPLQYLERALESKYEEIVASAIQGYLQVALNDATSQRRIIVILQQTLSHKLLRIRKQALAALETLLPADSPKADLLALECHYPDVIQAGLIRLYQRDMLASLEVSRQLMLLKNHDNAEVRQTAFYISVLSQPKLAAALKHYASQQGDTQLLRTLSDFDEFQLLRGTLLINESHNTDNKKSAAQSEQAISLTLSTQDFVTQAETANTGAKPKKEKAKFTITLSNQELEPLLQSLASPHQDISFRAAYALACLQDKRAFGALIRLMHAHANTGNDASIRAGVARALGTLAMEDGKAVLPVLLDDKDASVRMVAMKAFGKLIASPLAWAAVGFAAKHQDIHEQALALFLTQVLDDSVSQTVSTSAISDAMPTEMTDILLQALNNPFTSIRLEVVKVLLNRELKRASGSSITATITLLQQSLFEDVHQVAIEEWQRSLLLLNTKSKAQEATQADSIHQAVLTLLLADNFAAIREQAFDTALKNAKRLPFTEVMTSALASPFLDIKKLALTTLQAKANIAQLKDLLPALVGMLADDSIELRGQALSVALALTNLQPNSLALAADEMVIGTNNDTNNEALISAALASPYPDIQLTVAQLLASQSRLQAKEQAAKNDEQAYAVFERYLNTAMPTSDKSSDAYKQWHQHVSQALLGLTQLNTSKYDALNWYAKYLHHGDADFSDLAPKLMWLVSTDNEEHINLLIQWQRDERAIISQSASLALAVLGDTRGQYFFTQTVKNNSANNPFSHLAKPLTPIHWMQAQQGLCIIDARQLRHVFNSESYAPAARLLLIFNDIQQNICNANAYDTNKSNNKVALHPQRLIEALSFVDNETAVVYANILARYPAQLEDGFDNVWQYLSDYLKHKVGLILSAHSAVLDSMAHSVKASIKGGQVTKADSIREAILASISAPILRQLATLLSGNQPLLQARAVGVIGHLSELLSHHSYDNSDEVLVTLQRWQRGLQALLGSNKTEGNEQLVNAEQPAIAHSTASKNNSSYQTLAFGAWLGVIREGDDYYSNNHTTNQAIRGLMWLATQDDAGANNWSDSVSRALLPLLNHNDFDTRKLAWDCLDQLEVSASKRAEYAMSTNHPDMVKQGLQLLLKSIEGDSVSGISSANNISDDANSPSNQQLMTLLKTNNQSLAEETYKLLKQRLGLLPASLAALDSYCDALRYQAVSEWQQVKVTLLALPFAMHSSENATRNISLNQQRSDKLTFLLQAIQSDNWHTRYYAFVQLIDFYDVLFSDNHLLDALFEFWRDSQSWSDENQAFSLIISALQLYNRVNKADNDNTENNFDNGFDNESAKRIVDNTYTKLLGLLDYPQPKMSKLEMYQGIAKLHDTTVVAALLQRLRNGFEYLANQNKSERQQLFDTLVTISGYDQSIEDYLDESVDKRWLQQQHPRHPQVLLALFTTLMNYGDYDHAAQLLASLSWATAPENTNKVNITSQEKSLIDTEIDAQLALAYEQLPAKYILQLLQTLAYRAERRDASIATLQKALSNKDADVQFVAAEGLAKCGQPQGLTILMATVDYNPDGELRRRSVLAIGELMGSRSQDGGTRNISDNNTVNNNADAQTLYKAYDKLIKLAEDNEHYLQDVASEALGRLAQSGDFEYSNHIFEVLKSRLLDPDLYDYNPAIEHWLNGLRWLNTLAAWDLIRSYIRSHLQQDSFFAPQTHAISLLAFDNSFDDSFDNKDATKTLLLDILKQNDLSSYELMIAYAAAQKLWGNEGNTVYHYDWATLQNNDEYFLEEIDYLSLKRIVNNATIEDLTTFISQHGEQLPSNNLMSLQNAIMTKTDMSKAQLVALIDSSNVRAQHIGLSYLAQYPTDYLDKDMFATLQHRLAIAKDDWQTLIDTIERSPITVSNEQWLGSTAQTMLIIKHLIWLMCRYHPLIKEKANLKQMVENVTSYLSGAKSQTGIGHIIDWLNALRHLPVMTTVLPLATSINDFWQQLLLALLARPASDDSLLSDLLPLLHSIATAPTEPLSHANQALLTTLIMRLEQGYKPLNNINEQAAISINQQLLLWIKAKDATALYHCAINGQSDLSTQVRAIEALGQLHEPKIEQWLESLMQDDSDDNDEDIQKLAYKVLRRWQRAMARAQQKRPSAFASMDVINSPAVTAISTQSAGDNK